MREMMEIFPKKLRHLWNILELRILVLLSLSLQIILIVTGNRRKYRKNKLISALVWFCYLSADAVANIALGVLSQNEDDNVHSYAITAFWAPFLLMHLGGPDTITAYALADNELWGRHLLGLVSQVGVSFYVFLNSWIGTPINVLWMIVFVAGLTKYGERTWVLFSASRDQFRDSMVSRPDPGPNYAKFMDEFVSKESEGYRVSVGKAILDIVSSEVPTTITDPATNSIHAGHGLIEDAVILEKGYYFFSIFKQLFADLILSFQDKEVSLSYFRTQSWENAFSIVAVELGLIYDLFYTKAFILYSVSGFFLRLLSCSTTIVASVLFVTIEKRYFKNSEVIITYLLLFGAIFLEIYAIIILLSLDMIMIWLSENCTTRVIRELKDYIAVPICKMVSLLRYVHLLPSKVKWSDSMGQYNVLDYALECKENCTRVRQYLDKYLLLQSVNIPKGLKSLIFDELKARVNSDELHKRLGSYRGDRILLKEMNCFDQSDELEFDQSVLLWHMATDFCYHTNDDMVGPADRTWLDEFIVSEGSRLEDNVRFKREISKLLSNYMIHLLIKSPFMLPSGIGKIRFQDTCAEATEFFGDKKLSKGDACEKLLKVDTRIPPSDVKGDRSKTLLFDACKLVHSLKKLKVGEKWDKITQAWLDMLTYAAAQCSWSDHADKLSQGGELLTHVWLLMAHFGMTDHFQISQGYIRAKLETA